jgi:hypothetical protein
MSCLSLPLIVSTVPTMSSEWRLHSSTHFTITCLDPQLLRLGDHLVSKAMDINTSCHLHKATENNTKQSKPSSSPHIIMLLILLPYSSHSPACSHIYLCSSHYHLMH